MKNALKIILALLLLAAMLMAPLASCSKKTDNAPEEEQEEPLTEPGYYINRKPVVFAEEGDTDLSVLSVEKGLKINVVPFGEETVSVNGEKVDGELKLDCASLKAGDKLEFEITENGEVTSHTVNLYPSAFPAYTVEGESKVPGDFYMTTYDLEHNYAFKLNNKGELIFYMAITRPDEDGNEINTNAMDFRKQQNSAGEVRYTYMTYLADSFAPGCNGINPGCIRVYDKNYDLIDEVFYVDENGEDVMIDPHGFIWLDDGHYILTAYKREVHDVPEDIVEEKGTDKVDLAVLYVEEIKDGEVLWEFCSADYDKFINYSNTIHWDDPLNKCSDYMHFNSMFIDKDGDLLFSCRHQNAILKISRTDGSLIWQLGGPGDEFGLSEDQLFSYQHSIIVTDDGSYMIFDNANDAVGAGKADYSSVVRIKVDEGAKTVTDFTRYNVVEFFSLYMGAIRELDSKNSVYLWSVGGNYMSDAKNPPAWSMVEYTETEDGVSYNFSFKYDEGSGRNYCANKFE